MISLTEFYECVLQRDLLPYQRDFLELTEAMPEGAKIVHHPRGLGILLRHGDDFLKYDRNLKQWVKWV